MKKPAFVVAILFATCLTLLGSVPARQASAQQDVLRIVATVNDDIVSFLDLIARTRLAIVASRLDDSLETRQRVARQVLRSLIDEKLQMQEAARQNIRVSDTELEEAIQRIEAANRMQPGQFRQFIASAGIPLSSALDQIRANLAWNKVVRRKLRPMVDIGDTEIDEQLAKIRANIGKPENRVAEIFLAVDNPDQAPEVQRTAERLVQQLRAGTPFPALAQQFSQSPSAANGGDIGWVQEGQLDPQLDAVISRLQPREVSDPVRSYAGYHILLVIDRRTFGAGHGGEPTVSLRQLVVPVPPNATQAEVDSQMALAQQVVGSASSCSDFESLAREVRSTAAPSLGPARLSELPQDLRPVVSGLRVGQVSAPQRMAEGIRVVMVCSREGDDGLPSRDEIANSLLSQRLEMMARRYLRDLRQAAVIDIRI